MTEPAVPEISPSEAAGLAELGQVTLLDVRQPHEWQAGRAARARHIPLDQLDPGALPRDRPVVAVCRSGNRSRRAVELLLAAGHDASNMVGGMQAWAAHGLPVLAEDGSPGFVA